MCRFFCSDWTKLQNNDLVQKRLEGFVHFSELWNKPGKLAAGMELLVSPACSISFGKEKRACLYRKDVEEFDVLNLDDFTENKTMGCYPPALV